MIKGLAITPPIIGRISIGKIVERNGKRLPEKDDSFTITTQVQSRDGWMLHPLHNTLLNGAVNAKIRSIPVKLLFNDSNLNLRAEYSLFDKTNGRPMCIGNGEIAKRRSLEGQLTDVPCPSPDGCEWSKYSGCKPYGRLNVAIEGQEEELSSFIFRTTGFNSIRTLTARLHYFEAISSGYTRYLPLQLKLRAKSTTQSHRAPIYYVDLCLRDKISLEEAVSQAIAEGTRCDSSGLNIKALEQVARIGLDNGLFEDTEEEVQAIVEEFYSDSKEDKSNPSIVPIATPIIPMPTKLTNKLGEVNLTAVHH